MGDAPHDACRPERLPCRSAWNGHRGSSQALEGHPGADPPLRKVSEAGLNHAFGSRTLGRMQTPLRALFTGDRDRDAGGKE